MHPRGDAVSFGATILDAEGTRLSADEKRFFREADPFAFILFARNLETPEQIRALCTEMREAVGRDAPITIDQEGGRVQRLRPPMARDWLPPLDFVHQAGDHAEEAMYLRHRLIAADLRQYGIDSNCAPLVDVATEETHPFLKNRCDGTDPATVARLGRAAADGMLAGGVLPVVKHIPGHGRATSDSHFDLPRVTAPRRSLALQDYAPFAALNDLPMAMTAHVVYEAMDSEPATLSPTMIAAIRHEIGFDGLLMTDDISMKALKGDLAELSSRSIAAGCDVVLLCNASLDERRAVSEAAGRMGSEAQKRAEAVLAARHTPDEVDIPALEAKLISLLNGTLNV